ncbi:MAG: hypothetical protein GF393_12915 [Armatimonadia bacterium]|nr:hypothetical protein [Armatimonadia bacterium]
MDDDTPPPEAARPEVIKVVLKWLENNLKLKGKKRKCLRDGVVDGYPQWVLFDRREVGGNPVPKLVAEVPSWSSTLPSPWFEAEDGSDIDQLMVVSRRTKAELLAQFPNRRRALENFEARIKDDPGLLTQTLHLDNDESSDDKRNLLFDIVLSAHEKEYNGQYTVVEHYFSVITKQTVYISDAGDALVLPQEWSREEVQDWEDAHPEYDVKREQPIPTLWVTTFSTNGFIWENAQHWFQKQHPEQPYALLPGVCYIASMEDGLPMGYGEDMLPHVLTIAACETEGLDQVRRGTGRTTFIEEGSVVNPKYLYKELSAAEGVVLMKKGKLNEAKPQQETRQPNTTFFDMSTRERELLKEATLNDAMMGRTHPRQSNKAKETEIAQGMSPQAPYVVNYQAFNHNIAQMLCYMFPYFLTDRMLIEVDDEFGNGIEAIINEKEWPQGMSGTEEMNSTGEGPSAQTMGGEAPGDSPKGEELPYGQSVQPWEMEAKTILNDLTAVEYRVVPTPGDDSPTTLEQDTRQFAELMEAVGNSFIKLFEFDPKMFGVFLAKWNNRVAREMGEWILENADEMQQQQQQQAQMEAQSKEADRESRRAIEMAKLAAPNINYKISPEDVQKSPLGWQIMMAYANQQGGSQGGVAGQASSPSSAPAPGPAMQPQPEGVVG